MKILVIAPHPDDEVLGVGGTISKLACQGHDVTAVIVTKGWEPLFPNSQVEQVRSESAKAAKILGIKNLRFMDLPVTKLNELPKYELNKKFDDLITQEQPNYVFLPFHGDLHEDHRQVFQASMVALRPVADRQYVKRILCYETVSETHWTAPYLEVGFEPDLWVDISEHLPAKLEAMGKYKSQLQPEPSARSLEAIKSLSNWRGSIVGMNNAECFVTVRQYWFSGDKNIE
ncbi:MAG: PIG-L family deacetylase [Planctomycetes bacterium]|nr:PIG-L family deacetylase [Planctomycetota bacterium]